MKNKFAAILFFISIITSVNAQTSNFALFNNINYDIDSTNYDFFESLKLVNNNADIKFLIITGNISANGYTDEFEEVKSKLDSLFIKYYLLPGVNDIEKSLSQGTDYKETFGNSHFILKDKSILHIGLRCEKYPLNNIAHITATEIGWLSYQLKTVPNTEKIFIYLNYPLAKIDNSLKLKNLLSQRDVRIFITDKKTIYNIVNFKDDSLKIDNKFIDNTFYFIPQDSSEFIDYTQTINSKNTNLKFSINWQKDLNSFTLNSVLVDSNIYFVISQKGKIYCLNNNGEINWTHKLESEVVSKPTIINGILVAATLEGDLLTVNSITGQIIQSIGIDDVLSTEILKTKIDYYGLKTDAVIVGSKDGTFYCYTLDKLELVWSNNPSNSEIITKPLLVNNRIIYGSKDGYLYSIDDRTGVLYWKWNIKNEKETQTNFSNPVSDGENVFISASNGNIYKIDLLLGTTLWTNSKNNSTLSLGISSTGRSVLAFDKSEKFLLCYSKTGKMYRELKMDLGEDLIKHRPIEENINFLIPSDKGILYLINKDYEISPLLFLGNSALHSVQKLDDNKFIISNTDGRIVLFSLE